MKRKLTMQTFKTLSSILKDTDTSTHTNKRSGPKYASAYRSNKWEKVWGIDQKERKFSFGAGRSQTRPASVS